MSHADSNPFFQLSFVSAFQLFPFLVGEHIRWSTQQQQQQNDQDKHVYTHTIKSRHMNVLRSFKFIVYSIALYARYQCNISNKRRQTQISRIVLINFMNSIEPTSLLFETVQMACEMIAKILNGTQVVNLDKYLEWNCPLFKFNALNIVIEYKIHRLRPPILFRICEQFSILKLGRAQ